MKYHNDCPVCGSRKEWANNFLPAGVTIHSEVLMRRNVIAKENPGDWMVEIVSINNGVLVAHATLWGDDTCYIWEIDEVELHDGDLGIGFVNDGYEVDA